jgi:hypothetical protein
MTDERAEISLRVPKRDLMRLKSRALQDGVSYQTLINALIHRLVGTIVEELDDAAAFVEFSDEQGRAYAIAPCLRDALLPLRTEPLKA